jgi:hypothetical protein
MPNLSFVGALLAAPVYACLLPSSCHSWITSYPLLNKERVGTCAGVRCFQRKSLAKKSLRPGFAESGLVSGPARRADDEKEDMRSFIYACRASIVPPWLVFVAAMVFVTGY